jgi:hypothetical protein
VEEGFEDQQEKKYPLVWLLQSAGGESLLFHPYHSIHFQIS